MVKRVVIPLALLLLLLVSVRPGWAAPAFDAASASAEGTGTLSWTHTPVGTPRGVVVLIQQIGSADDQVSGVTYGGVTMTEVSGSPQLAAGFTKANYTFFLGASVPTGAQTVEVTVSGANSKRAVAITITANADTSVDATDTDINSASLDDPSGSIATSAGVETVLLAVLGSGIGNPANLDVGTSYTEILEHDFGINTASWMRRTTNPTGGDVTYNWTTGSAAEALGMAVAVREGVPAPAVVPAPQRSLLGVGS